MRRQIMQNSQQGVAFWALIVATFGLVLLGGCGDSKATDTAESENAAGVYNEAAEESPDPEPVESETTPPMDLAATMYLESEEGYSAKVVLARGKIERAKAGLRNGQLSLGTDCEVDERTDAAQPFRLTIHNTTEGFPASPGVDILADTPEGGLQFLPTEMGYSAGAECLELHNGAFPGDEASDYLGYEPTEPLVPGDFISGPGFFIIPDYYSPAHPGGNPQKIRGVVLTVAPPFGGEFAIERTSGFLDSELPGLLPLLPGSNGGCIAHPPCEPGYQLGY